MFLIHKEQYIMYKNFQITPTTTPKCLISVAYCSKLRVAITFYQHHHLFTNYTKYDI